MDYNKLQQCLNALKSKHNITVQSIGTSVLGKNIYAILVENNINYKWAIITAGIHAREHLSCDLVIMIINKYIKQTANYKYNIAFVPLVNPDGATLCTSGVENLSVKQAQKLIDINGGGDFSLFKANANGVDLNNNFDANWNKQFTNKKQPSSQGYYGETPNSEPETQALVSFTEKIQPFITISYHLKGEEIYFDFYQDEKNYKRDKKIAQIFAQSTGYKIKSTQHVSSGGYKDWCVQHLKIPALTIELGNDKFAHPYPQNQINNIFNKNKNIFKCLNKALKIYNRSNTNELYGASSLSSTKSI